MASSLISLILLQTLVVFQVTSKTFPGDIEALKSLKNSINPNSILPGSCLSTWDFAYDPCDSAFTSTFTCGFRCDYLDLASSLLRVTALSLDSAAYSGTLPSSLFSSLPFLSSADLAGNLISGSIPSCPLPPLLRRLVLSRNSLSGSIPPSLFSSSSLEELILDNNLLSGQMPHEIASLPSLKRLEIQSNNLTGGIPDLRQISGLLLFDASDNALSGTFPKGGHLPVSLVQISLRSNRLYGPLPAESVADLPFLQVMDISHNELSGTVPATVFLHPSLEQVSLAWNRFESLEEPVEVATGSRVISLDMGHNRLGGLLPWFIGVMPRLAAVNLEENRFTGLIPFQYAVRVAGLGERVGFARLMLEGNYLLGPIPSPMGWVKEGSAAVSLADNCLSRCPQVFFFCKGGQKSADTCRLFNPVIHQ
ncbi:uncharacterized protein [Typha angustifolia]|uniref:uncharacterized protein n=1 Tax=Typha angustifolia TaxID=59011 RepID=UPI003C309931